MKISIRNFSIASIILWVSFLVYLPPFKFMPSMVHQEIVVESLKAYGLLFFGILSGVLMLFRYKYGRILAFIIAFFVLYSKLVALFPNVSQKTYSLYVLMLKQSPIMVIHNDVLLPLFMVFTILYILKKTETLPVNR